MAIEPPRRGKTPRAELTMSEQRDLLDPVKRMVAVSVQNALITGAERPRKTGVPPECQGHPVGFAVTPLVTMVQVETEHGPRHFLVKVMETAAT